ncbi:MAG: WbqC family protein [Planctomycetes bacterium]|nr:WbqC family protein [Planctomycetota bacterium]
MKVAVMQPCYLPWRGYFALLRLADVFIHLDDAPLPRGRSYQTRTTIKTAQGVRRLSLPVRRQADQLIRDARLAGDSWRRKHLASLRQHLPRAAEIVAPIYEQRWTHLAELNVALAAAMAEALAISTPTRSSSSLDVTGRGSDRILDLCRVVGATVYLTGHGGAGYLDHELFESEGVEIRYLDYDLAPYDQPHGPFDPYVTALDVLEHAPDAARRIGAVLRPWRAFLATAS